MYGNYVAYVGSYTRGKAKGITILDVDVENGYMGIKKELSLSNVSFLTVNEKKMVLYAVHDTGITAFKILQDGDLERMNTIGINGMRGSYLELDTTGQFIYVAGYYDGKITMLELGAEGQLVSIVDEIFFKGIGRPYDDSYRPHVSCCKLTPFDKFLCVADLSVSNYKVYEVDRNCKALNFVSLIPCELDSGPREIVFSNTGRFAYTVSVRKKQIEAFEYKINSTNKPVFTRIQKLNVLSKGMVEESAPFAISINRQGTYLIASMVEDNSVTFIKRNKDTGLIEIDFNLPISGVFPKDIEFLPNDKFIASCNHESHEVTLFEVDNQKKTLIMTQRPLSIYSPNCIRFCKLRDEQ